MKIKKYHTVQERPGHRAKKSLGQNFLKSTMALKKIIEAGKIKPNDTILEIGPGKGALTEKLLEKAGYVIAIEKDKDLYELLKIKFAKEIENKKFILVNDDILKLQITNYELRKYKIIANIPYNITGAILKKFLTGENPSGIDPRASQPNMMVLMVQHEVAKRIIANDKKESILSISVKAYGEPKMIMKVPARYFSPAPKVDSAIIKISNISRKLFEQNSQGRSLRNFEERFWEIIHAGFAHKRKKLSNNLKKTTVQERPGQWRNARAEDLSLQDWINLVKIN